MIDQLVQYRGTTAAAVAEMQAAGFRSAVRLGLQAAERRANTMIDESGAPKL
jgi:pyrroline-5-carboxylate reductase